MHAGLLVIFAIGFVLFLFILMQVAKAKARKVDEVWERAAKELGGDFTPAEVGFFKHEPRRIEIEVEDVPIVVDHVTKGSGNSKTTYTRLTAPARTSPDSELHVYNKRLFTGLARALGFQDVPTDDADFDEAYVVKSPFPGWAKLWLLPPVREQMTLARDLDFEIEKGEVVALRVGLVESVLDIDLALRAVAAFSDASAVVVKSWSDVASDFDGAVERADPDGARLHASYQGARVLMETTEVGGEGFTRIQATLPGARLEPFDLVRDEAEANTRFSRFDDAKLPEGLEAFAETPSAMKAVLDESARSRLARTRPTTVRSRDDNVEMLVEGILLEKEAAATAIELAAELALAAKGDAYR